MRPIKLQIRKKMLVPTKHAIVHQWRSDWKPHGYVDYEQSKELLYNVEGRGFIRTDAQFTKWIFDQWGEGIYSVVAWRKGLSSFYSFMKVQLFKDGFMRIPREFTKEQREKMDLVSDYRRLKKREGGADEEEKTDIKSEIDSIKDIIDLSKEIIQMEKVKNYGPHPYLESKHPVYKMHEYEDYGTLSTQESQDSEGYQGIW